MKRILAILLFISSLSVPNDQTHKTVEIPLKVLAPGTKKIDPYVQFQYTMASLGHASFKLMEKKQEAAHIPFLRLDPKTAQKIDAILELLYHKNMFAITAHIFRQNNEKGVDAGITLFQSLATILELSIKPIDGLESTNEKISWLEDTAKSIKTAYENDLKIKFAPQNWKDLIKSQIVLNRLTKNMDFTEFGKPFVSTFMSGAGAVAGAISSLSWNSDEKKHITELGILAALALGAKPIACAFIGAAGMTFVGYQATAFLVSLEKEKSRLDGPRIYLKNKKLEKKYSKYAGQHVTPTYEGFEKIRGVQDESVLQELEFFNNWLKYPLRYAGKSRQAIMLYGEPGNGKGTVTKALAAESSAPLVVVNVSDFHSSQKDSPPEILAKLHAIEYLAWRRNAKSVVIFFDEIDEIIKSNPDSLHFFLTWLDGAEQTNPHLKILSVFATNYIDKIDERMLRAGRFKSKIYVGPPNKEQRKKLIASSLKDLFQMNAPEKTVEIIAEKTNQLSRVAIYEILENSYNHAVMVNELPNMECFEKEIENIIKVSAKRLSENKSDQLA